MKEINMNKKFQIIKLFLNGTSYDDIAKQVGVAKGSVVNIINELRDGNLPVPPGMTEYIDTLRKLAVDLLKHQTSVVQLKSYIKLHTKLQAMGINDDLAEQWLDICQGIASPAVSNEQFVKAALELAEVTSVNQLSYDSLVQEYSEKLELSKKLDIEIQQKKEVVTELNQEYEKNKNQSINELNSITKAIATAQDTYQKQKDELKIQLEEYLVKNKLTWDNINTISAILHSVLGNAGLNQKDIEKISKDIADAGSLVIYTKQLEGEKQKLQATVDWLSQQEKALTISINKLGNKSIKLFDSILEKGQEEKELDAKLEVKQAKLAELEKIVSGYIDDILNVRIIIGFLVSPKDLGDSDIDKLVRLMIYLRQQRLGVGPQQVKDANGNVVCACKVPQLYVNVDEYEINRDEARRRLALYLVPLVKDKFVPRFEYDLTKLSESILELNKLTYDLL